MNQVRKLKLLAFVSLVAAAAVACSKSGSDTTAPPDPGGVLGTYVLKTINGSAPPGVYYISASERLMLDTATLRINANNTYSYIKTTTMFDVRGATVAYPTQTGMYTVSGNDITIAFTNNLGIPSTQTYTVSGRTLTGTEQGVALVFMK